MKVTIVKMNRLSDGKIIYLKKHGFKVYMKSNEHILNEGIPFVRECTYKAHFLRTIESFTFGYMRVECDEEGKYKKLLGFILLADLQLHIEINIELICGDIITYEKLLNKGKEYCEMMESSSISTIISSNPEVIALYEKY